MAYINCCEKELKFITDMTESGLNIYECPICQKSYIFDTLEEDLN